MTLEGRNSAGDGQEVPSGSGASWEEAKIVDVCVRSKRVALEGGPVVGPPENMRVRGAREGS